VGEDEIDIADILRSLGRQWRKIAVVTVLIGAIAVWWVLRSVPQFTVTGSVYLGETTAGAGSGGNLPSGVNILTDFASVSDVDTQVALIQSGALLQNAILETGLNASAIPEGRPSLRYWRWRYIYGQSIDAYAPQPGDLKVLYATLSDPGGGGMGGDLIFGENGNYTVTAGGGWFSRPYTILTGKINQPASGRGVAFMIKPAVDGVIPPAGSRFKLLIIPAKVLSAAFQLTKPLSVVAGGTTTQETNIANLTFEWSDPYAAQEFVNQLMNDFIATELRWKTQSASATEAFISDELRRISASLANANQQLASYQSNTGILDVPTNAQTVIQQLSQYESQQMAIQLQQEALQQLSSSLASSNSQVNPYLISQSQDPAIAQLANQLATAEATLEADRVQFTPNAPEIQGLQAQISKLETAIASLVANDEAAAARALQDIQGQITLYKNTIKSMPSEGLQVLTLTQASQVYGQLYVMLMQKEEEAEVSKASTIVATKIVTPGEIPLDATKPRAALTIFAGLLLGIFAGVGLVLAQRAVAGTFQSDDDIRRTVQLPIYGLVPHLSREEIARGVLSARAQSPFSEAFRLLRSNLYQSGAAQQSRIILVTSATTGDGKTTVSSNLAKFLADDGKRVVLIDGDLHRGRVHEVLKVNQTPGLTEWIVTGERPKLQSVEGQRFVVLPTGTFPPNPSELLNEGQLAEIFKTLRTEFDYIIVDCPPLPAVSDTMPLGQNADLILSIVHINHTSRRAFALHNETIATLDRRHGMVINGIIGSVYGYGYGDGYTYGYGYGYESEPQPEARTFVGKFWRVLTRVVKRLS
jgi:capsular exopolysaccharide synthesis family protein